jgi:hypothetical protein
MSPQVSKLLKTNIDFYYPNIDEIPMFSPTCVHLTIAIKKLRYFATGCFLMQLSNDKLKSYAVKADEVLKNLSNVKTEGVSAMSVDTVEYTAIAALLLIAVGAGDLCEIKNDTYVRNLCRLFKLEYMRREFDIFVDMTKVCISDTSPTDYEQGLGDVEIT